MSGKTYTQRTLKAALAENDLAREQCYTDAGGEKAFHAMPFRAQLGMFKLAESETRAARRERKSANRTNKEAFSTWIEGRINALNVPKSVEGFSGNVRATFQYDGKKLVVSFGRSASGGGRSSTAGKLLQVGGNTYASYRELCDKHPLRQDASLTYEKRGGEKIHVLDVGSESAQRVWNSRFKSAYPDKWEEVVFVDDPEAAK